MSRRLTLALPLAFAFLAACQDDSSAPVTDPAVATYAPELGVDINAMTRTASGLYIQDLTPGTGATAQRGQLVDVHYSGWLTNGRQFDSSRGREPLCFTIGGNVITGWNEGVPEMQVGGKRKLVVPPHLGYGPGGNGPIPGNAILVFDIELLEILQAPPAGRECI